MDSELGPMLEGLRRQQQDIERIRRDVDAMVVKGRSRGNEVEVSIRGTGRVIGIAIDPAAIRHNDAHDLGVVITEAVNDALDNVAKSSQARFAPALAALPR